MPTPAVLLNSMSIKSKQKFKKMKIFKLIPVLFVSVMILVAGCAESGEYNEAENGEEAASSEEAMTLNDTSQGMDSTQSEVTSSIAVIHPTQGNNVMGTVTFDKGSGGVQVHAVFSGLPEGPHGFHVHLYGDCSAEDGTSAGTHFNFIGSSENPPSDIDRITGNLGNAIADASGNATADTTISNIAMSGSKSIIGRAVVVHAQANDPSQPPIGAAGARLGCGVIGIAQSDTTGMN